VKRNNVTVTAMFALDVYRQTFMII